MHKVFLVTYDLKNKQERDYSGLYDAIKEIGDWQHPLDSMWVVRTDSNATAQSLYKIIRPHIVDGDRLFVIEITDSDRYGWLPRNFWTWLRYENND